MKVLRIKKAFIFSMILTIAFCANVSAQNRGAGNVKIKGADGQTKDVKLYDGSFALVIGNSNYSNGWDALAGVKSDVTAVKQTLERQGFKVETAENLSARQFDDRVKQFIDDYGYEPKNRLLIYYAGHGHTLRSAGDGREVGYIVPIDAPNPAKDELGFRRKAVSMDTIQTYAKQIQAKHAIFIFDSCFSGRLVSRGEVAIPPFIQENVAFAVRQFITAGAANQIVPDESIFRRAFVRGLDGDADRNHDGYIIGSELADYLKEKVTNYSNRRQTPQYGKINDIELDQGDFVFILPTNQNIAALDPPKAKPPTKNSPNDLKLEDLKKERDRNPDGKTISEALSLPKNVVPLIRDGLKQGYERLDKKMYELAEQNFSQVIAIAPKNVEAHRGRGIANYFLKENDLALRDLNMAISLDTKNMTAFLYRSFVYRRLGKFEKSADDYEVYKNLKVENDKKLNTGKQLDESNIVSAIPAPSSIPRTYDYPNLLKVDVPENWVETPNASSGIVTFAPEGATMNGQFTNGFSFQQIKSKNSNFDITSTTEKITAEYLNNNKNTEQIGKSYEITVNGRKSKLIVFVGISPITNEREKVNIIVVPGARGNHFILTYKESLVVVNKYSDTYALILNSIKFKN